MKRRTAVVIPALNEAGNIESLITELRDLALVDWTIVVDNGSEDDTAALAQKFGALVVAEPRRGYGYACLAGANVALEMGAEILAFMDGDFSSLPGELPRLLAPIARDEADLVLGSRTLGAIAGGAMPFHQRLGNWLAAWLMSRLYGVRVTDLGPYRAIRAGLFRSLAMSEMTFGWPTEMMVKAARKEARLLEVPVTWQTRHRGRSKVGGTVRGSILAAYHILTVTLRFAFTRERKPMGKMEGSTHDPAQTPE
jgi:glycosyltransferase involved in cell wall biosynthesis